MPVDPPTDVLREIFRYCHPTGITSSCKYFASVAHSIPSLWSPVHLGQHQFVSEGPEFLSRRLQRAGSEPLEISIGPINDEKRYHPTIVQICHTLSTFSDAIVLFEISTETASLAAKICCDIFRKSVFPRLCTFSFRVEDDSLSMADFSFRTSRPRLDRLLRDGSEKSPMLQTLSLSSFYECLPMPPKGASFAHLHTLVIDGSLEGNPPEMILIVALLHSTPQLETLWIKHTTGIHFSVVPEDDATPSDLMKDRDDIRSPVFLPRLNRIAVVAPGCALDVLHCIDAPALQDLHIDGSRGPVRGTDERNTIDWTGLETDDVRDTLNRLSLRSRQLRRIAFTSAHIPHRDWKWLLFGDGGVPPFQLLESIALHGIEETPESERCGFNDALLTRYAREPILPLRRLAFLRCNFPLSGSVVVRAFKSAASSGVPEDGTLREFEYEWGPSCPQITDDDLNELVGSGVKVTCRLDGEVKEDEWWTRGHRVDAFDLHAY